MELRNKNGLSDRDRAMALGAVSWRVQRELAGYGQHFFKRLLNSLFGAYQDEIDDYALTETMNNRARAAAERTAPVRASRPAETNSREAQEEATHSAPSQERSMSEAENTNHIEAENETRERTNFNELNKTSARTTSAVDREKEMTKSNLTLN